MQSMCRHSYAASWPHNKDHCPNLIASEDDIKKLPGLRKRYGNIKSKDVEKLVPITIKYSKENKIFHDHLSFGHYYSEWYNDYWEADYPRLMVRFEDLLFHGEEYVIVWTNRSHFITIESYLNSLQLSLTQTHTRSLSLSYYPQIIFISIVFVTISFYLSLLLSWSSYIITGLHVKCAIVVEEFP